MKHLVKFSDFLAEDFASPAATLQNTPGMGNVQPGEASIVPIRKRKKERNERQCINFNYFCI